jgi:ribosome biogenesis GTPase / thiamine phosphate phosphatase
VRNAVTTDGFPNSCSDEALRALGWTSALSTSFERLSNADGRAGRVAIDFGAGLLVLAPDEERVLLSRELYRRSRDGDRVAVGDWVVLDGEAGSAEVVERLPRRSTFSRRRPGAPGSPGTEQVIAANIDTAFVVTDPQDFNVRRLERYATLVADAGAEAVIVVTKTDRPSTGAPPADVSLPGTTIHSISSSTGEGIEALDLYLRPGRTVCLVGSSGVGKSTLVNRLLGRQHLKTQSESRHGKGRHTTTHRELVRLESGALLIDNPGMREVGLLPTEPGSYDAFADVSALAAACRFADCAHVAEPGCAVRRAISAGTLPRERLATFLGVREEPERASRRSGRRSDLAQGWRR